MNYLIIIYTISIAFNFIWMVRNKEYVIEAYEDATMGLIPFNLFIAIASVICICVAPVAAFIFLKDDIKLWVRHRKIKTGLKSIERKMKRHIQSDKASEDFKDLYDECKRLPK